MSNKSKIAAIAAASLGMVLTQSSSLRADSNAPERVTKIVAPVDWSEEVLYSAFSDDDLEKAVGFGFGGVGACSTATCNTCFGVCNQSQTVKKPPYVGLKYEDKKVPPMRSTGPTIAPKPTQGNKIK
jgi:hypothetical protein